MVCLLFFVQFRMDKVNKFIRPLGFRRRTRSASSVGMFKLEMNEILHKVIHNFNAFLLLKHILVIKLKVMIPVVIPKM